MARRQGAITKALTEREADELHRAARRHFNRLTMIDGINLAEYQAQLVEQDMVKVLSSMALDTTGYTSPALRRQCAMDVISIARGAIKVWVHDGQTIDPNAQIGENKMGDLIEAAQVSAKLNMELDRLTREKIPPAQWPAEIREMVGDKISFYESDL